MSVGLVAWVASLLLVFPVDDADSAAKYKELTKDWQARQLAFYNATQNARTKEQRAEAERLFPHVNEITPRFLEFARSAPASGGAFAACAWIVINAPGGREAEDAFRILAEHHVNTRTLGIALKVVTDWPSDAGRNLLRAVADKSTRDDNRGYARLALGTLLAADSRRMGSSGKAQHDEAKTLLSAVLSDHAQLKIEGGQTYADLARSSLAKLDAKPKTGTEIGDLAPEISGPNSKGRPMRLSGFRGSVVILDFWADWCPWCHEIYAFSRSLDYRFKDKPFALVGVNSDGDRNVMRRALQEGGSNWLNWWLGENTQIARDYPVQRYPTTLILDRDGIIRYRYFGPVDEDSMTLAAQALFEEKAGEAKADARLPSAPGANKPPLSRKKR